MKRQRWKSWPFALIAAVLMHVGLLSLLTDWGASPSPIAPVVVSLWDTEGPTTGPSPESTSGSTGRRPEAAAVLESAAAKNEASPSPSDAATPVQPAELETASLNAEAPVEPSIEITPDPTAEAAEPPSSVSPEMLEAYAAAAASPTSDGPAAIPGALSGAGDPCRLTEWLQGLLSNDASVQAALARLPPDRRSVANAVMLWDGRWVEARSSPGEDLLRPVREAILAGLTSAPPNCREHSMTGPRFIALADQRRATVLALGSGTWRWSDLLAAPAATPSTSPPFR